MNEVISGCAFWQLPASDSTFYTNRLVKEGKSELILEWLKGAGITYSDIYIEEFDSYGDTVMVEKNVIDEAGDILESVSLDLDKCESTGTKKFYSFIGRLYYLFLNGSLLVSDEIDNHFHPVLLKHVVRLFNDPAINQAGAQLLFTTHDTNLMQPDILRQDQIYFAEKIDTSETILYS